MIKIDLEKVQSLGTPMDNSNNEQLCIRENCRKCSEIMKINAFLFFLVLVFSLCMTVVSHNIIVTSITAITLSATIFCYLEKRI